MKTEGEWLSLGMKEEGDEDEMGGDCVLAKSKDSDFKQLSGSRGGRLGRRRSFR